MLWIQFPKILCFSLQPGLGDQLVQKGSGENCWTPDRLPNLLLWRFLWLGSSHLLLPGQELGTLMWWELTNKFKLEEKSAISIIRRDWTFRREQKTGADTWMQVWDWQKDRWFMVGSHMRMAASEHKGGAFGWRGYCTSSLYIYMAVVNSSMCTFRSLLAKVGRWRFHHQLIILGWN